MEGSVDPQSTAGSAEGSGSVEVAQESYCGKLHNAIIAASIGEALQCTFNNDLCYSLM